jgi:hypothetical protein
VKHLSASALHSKAAGVVYFRNSSRRGRSTRTRWIIGSGVLLLHIWVLVFLARVSPPLRFPPESASSLVLLDLPAVSKLNEKPITKETPKSSVNDASKRQSKTAEGDEAVASDRTARAAAADALIDWSGELETIAKAAAPKLLAERLQKCHDAEMHGKILLGCGKVKTPDILKWDTGKTGLANLLSVGKREANGHLFDDMNDPDRDRSSVPDIAALQQVPHRPVPLAFDPRRDDFTQ